MDLFWQTWWQPGDSNLKTYTPSPSRSLPPRIYLQPEHLNALFLPNLPCSSAASSETSPYFTGYGILWSDKGCRLICERCTGVCICIDCMVLYNVEGLSVNIREEHEHSSLKPETVTAKSASFGIEIQWCSVINEYKKMYYDEIVIVHVWWL